MPKQTNKKKLKNINDISEKKKKTNTKTNDIVHNNIDSINIEKYANEYNSDFNNKPSIYKKDTIKIVDILKEKSKIDCIAMSVGSWARYMTGKGE